MGFMDSPEYNAGRTWAHKNQNRLAESYSNDDIIGGSLRMKLFEEAGKLYPAAGGNMENDLRQTLWVMGAFRHIVDTLPMTREAMIAALDAASDLGAIYSVEVAKLKCFKELKAKDPGWWKKKLGDATPADVVAAATVGWRVKRRVEKSLGPYPTPKSIWEVLVDAFGSREMCLLSHAQEIELVQDRAYWYYWVHGPESGFQMIMRPVVQDGRLVHVPGDLIG